MLQENMASLKQDEKTVIKSNIPNLDQVNQQDSMLLLEEKCDGQSESSLHRSATDLRSLRSHYLDVKDLIMGEGREISRAKFNKFDSMITKVENLHQLVQKPREQVADAEALLDIAKTLFSSLKSSENHEGVLLSNFVSSLLDKYGENEVATECSDCKFISWMNMGLDTSYIFRKAPGICTMIGPMDTKPTHKKAFIRRKRSRAADIFHPEEVEDTAYKNNIDTDVNMSTMFGILKEKKCVQLEQVVLNRVSFSQTVENIFALSFLVKDGKAEISVDDSGMHFVSPQNAPSLEEIASGKATCHHFIFRFDYRDWEFMMDSIEIGEELMPHRIEVDDSVSDFRGCSKGPH